MTVEAVKTPEEASTLGFLPRATFAVAAAWSLNPKKPPMFVDLPTVNGVADKAVLARWATNAPLPCWIRIFLTFAAWPIVFSTMSCPFSRAHCSFAKSSPSDDDHACVVPAAPRCRSR